MIRGIEFKINIQHKDILNEILKDISLDDYDFYISEDEVICNNGKVQMQIPKKGDEKLFENLAIHIPYYVDFINLRAYKKGQENDQINNYTQFINSECQFIILIVDGQYLEIYAKSDNLILQFIKNAVQLKGEEIKIKTDYDDGRVRMSVW